MDQTFNFRSASVPLLRRVKPRSVALAVAVSIGLGGLASFSRWVIDSERDSVARAGAAAGATSITGSTLGPIGGTTPGTDDLEGGDPVAGIAIDDAARSDALAALDAARRAASGSSTFLDAGPGQLGSTASSLIFVDGPAQGPGVVSVASTSGTWGAAVMAPSGTCYLVRLAAGGVSYGVGRSCSGDEALAARDPSW